MDCRRVAGMITEAVVGELPPARRSTVRKHLRACGACRTAFRRTCLVVGLVDYALGKGPCAAGAAKDDLAQRPKAAGF